MSSHLNGVGMAGELYTDPASILDNAPAIIWLARDGKPKLWVSTADDSRQARLRAEDNVLKDYSPPIVSNVNPAEGVDPTWAGTTVVVGRSSFLANADRYLEELAEAGNYLLVVARGNHAGRQPFVVFQAVKDGMRGTVTADELLDEPEKELGANACGGFPAAPGPVGF